MKSQKGLSRTSLPHQLQIIAIKNLEWGGAEDVSSTPQPKGSVEKKRKA